MKFRLEKYGLVKSSLDYFKIWSWNLFNYIYKKKFIWLFGIKIKKLPPLPSKQFWRTPVNSVLKNKTVE